MSWVESHVVIARHFFTLCRYIRWRRCRLKTSQNSPSISSKFSWYICLLKSNDERSLACYSCVIFLINMTLSGSSAMLEITKDGCLTLMKVKYTNGGMSSCILWMSIASNVNRHTWISVTSKRAYRWEHCFWSIFARIPCSCIISTDIHHNSINFICTCMSQINSNGKTFQSTVFLHAYPGRNSSRSSHVHTSSMFMEQTPVEDLNA